MFKRYQTLTTNHSFFLFGPRGSGKSTLLLELLHDKAYFIDLLGAEEEAKFLRNPDELSAIVRGLNPKHKFVVIDEIQKVPKLLDVVHKLIEQKVCYFALSGSSARKLKKGSANLLAGRAFVFSLFPLTSWELGNDFELNEVLAWGSLPKIFELKSKIDKNRFLTSYAHTYLKEEVWAEQIVKNLEPFRRFLEVAAQCNGKIINYSKIARDTGVEDKTVKSYYEILVDTLLGIRLEAYHPSFRKRFQSKPKFYFFDVGVTRCLANLLDVAVHPSTSYYGELFEQFLILEIHRLNEYFETHFRLSYLLTSGGVEIDLIVERPGKTTLLIEIKSGTAVYLEDLKGLQRIHSDLENSEMLCLYNGKDRLVYEDISVMPWQQGVLEIVFEKDLLLNNSSREPSSSQ